MRAVCGGGRRAASLHADPSSGAITFAYFKDGRVHVAHQGGGGGAEAGGAEAGAGGACRLLGGLVGHGREVHAVRLLQAPGGGAAAAVLTASEEGSVRRLLYSSAGGGSPGSGSLGSSFVGCGEVGRHSGSSAVRCLDCAPMPGAGPSGPLLLVSGGAKEMLTAWLLTWGGGSGEGRPQQPGPPQLRQQLLSTRMPPGKARPKANLTGRSEQDAERRYMALCIAQQQPGAAYVAASSSDAGLRLLRLDLQACSWATAAELSHHRSPVLCLASVALPPPGAGQQAVLLASGATDGSVALWRLDPALGGAGAQGGGLELRPLCVLQGLHQSGVNDLSLALLPASLAASAASAGGGGKRGQPCAQLLLACGGDDQGLSACALRVSAGGGGGPGGAAVQLAGHCRLANAHSSAVRGVALAGQYLVSTGLDQRLRCWLVSFSGARGAEAAGAEAAAPSAGGGGSPRGGGGPGGGGPGGGGPGGEGPAEIVVPRADSGMLQASWWQQRAQLRPAAAPAWAGAAARAAGGGGGSMAAEGLQLLEVAGCVTEVLEPSCLDAAALRAAGGGWALRAVVSGRGTQVLELQLTGPPAPPSRPGDTG
jgi:hypothetical protein